jgi:two-component system invasion response regulator UvrY
MKKIAIVDDHSLVRHGLSEIIKAYSGYRILLEATNGQDLIEQLLPEDLPDLILLDVSMPVMNGYETALWIRQHYPQIRILALSMLSDERSVLKMIQCGARGYILKEVKPAELIKALDEVCNKGIYFNELLCGNLLQNIKNKVEEPQDDYQKMIALSEREKDFLKRLCLEKSLKEIAADMHLSPRTIDGYRDNLFEKLKVTSRIGLVMFAIRNGLVQL